MDQISKFEFGDQLLPEWFGFPVFQAYDNVTCPVYVLAHENPLILLNLRLKFHHGKLQELQVGESSFLYFQTLLSIDEDKDG